jgi:hypothetical protein
MKKIIYKTDEGGVAVIVPSSEYLSNHTIEELAAKDVPSGVEYYIVNASTIPTDRKYRSAWELVNKKIEVNQVKASKMDAQEELRNSTKQSLITKLASTLTPEETALLEELL